MTTDTPTQQPDAARLRPGDVVTDGHGNRLTIDELPYMTGIGLLRAAVHYDNGETAVAEWGPRFTIPLAVDPRTRK